MFTDESSLQIFCLLFEELHMVNYAYIHTYIVVEISTGMSGSCQDFTIIRKSLLWTKLVQIGPNSYFDQGQYILSDLGYMNVPHMVSSFKRTNSNPYKEAFNICIVKCHVTNEHCIGVLKSRWHSLKELRFQFKKKSNCEWTVRWINMCAKLHNFVMDMNDVWIEEDPTIMLVAHQTVHCTAKSNSH